MKVLVVGGGGREHAIIWKLLRDDPETDITCAPGNAGIAAIARCAPVAAGDIERLCDLAIERGIELTVVGPEAPLAAGIVDHFRERGLAVFGPTRRAAEIETSKSFAKQLMLRAGVPTARASTHTSIESAKLAIRKLGAPVVVKASGLASGKGVVVATSIEEADRAVDSIMGDRVYGDAGSETLIEEFMEGEEISLFALTDGERVLPMLAAQDHKRLLDGDLGPNTGGMGAYAPVSLGSGDLVASLTDSVFAPTLAAMREAGSPFSGLLYAGLMLTADGPRVVEFNCRFGDPETQAILPLMQSPLLPLLAGIARGDGLAGVPPLEWTGEFAVTTVLAAHGYPSAPRMGDAIHFSPPPHGVHVFHGATAQAAETKAVVTSGGRVLAVTAVATSMEEAATRSRLHAEKIGFAGRQMRRDIGHRELDRARAS